MVYVKKRKVVDRQSDEAVAEFVSQFYGDPLGFVRGCFPWGEAGTLEEMKGPDVWQVEVLERIGEAVRARRFDGVGAVEPVRLAVSSGHGVGKSTLQAWLVCWVMSTRPGCRGTVTANTNTQLDTKTWAAVQKWARLCMTSHWFECNTQRMFRVGQRESWFCGPQSCKEENSESFAGQHAADSTSFYVFDEGSAVPDVIYDVAEGGLTDGEPMIFVFGNPTRSTGRFHQICFGSLRQRWNPVVVDARDAAFTNKQQLAEWMTDYGEDSDFVRVRIKGLPPAASDLQYIDTATVMAAQSRTARSLADDPLVCGFDVARGGGDTCVVWFRKGSDARTIAPIKVPGEQTKDSMRLVTIASEVLSKTFNGQQVAMMFVDGTGIGGPILDRLIQLGYGSRVVEVQFGAHSPDPKYANMRSYMWGKLREWLQRGAIPQSRQLEQDLTSPGYRHDRHDKLLLEPKEQMKARGAESPDEADALALTFATPVNVKARVPAPRRRINRGGDAWLGA